MQEATKSTIAAIINADPTVSPTEAAEIVKALQTAGRPKRHETISGRQAAEILGVHRYTVRRYERQGKLSAVRISKRKIRFDREQVERLAGIVA